MEKIGTIVESDLGYAYAHFKDGTSMPINLNLPVDTAGMFMFGITPEHSYKSRKVTNKSYDRRSADGKTVAAGTDVPVGTEMLAPASISSIEDYGILVRKKVSLLEKQEELVLAQAAKLEF